MHAHHSGLDPINLAMLHEEWDRLNTATRTANKKAAPKKDRPPVSAPESPCSPELSPVITVLPGLIRLVNECTDRPVNKFRPTIKRLIREQLFMEEAGDAVVDPHQNVQIESYVELTVCVLVRVREYTQGHDGWSDTPVTPQMFG